MNLQKQIPVSQKLHELDSLYCSGSIADYENALKLAIMDLQEVLPDCTIAYAEIATTGSERQAHGGMRHVLFPEEGNA